MTDPNHPHYAEMVCGDPGTMTLLDDGTLDTVFGCDVCGTEVRYSTEWAQVYRDETGALTDKEAYTAAEEDHAYDVA